MIVLYHSPSSKLQVTFAKVAFTCIVQLCVAIIVYCFSRNLTASLFSVDRLMQLLYFVDRSKLASTFAHLLNLNLGDRCY
jgi:hypothetical protein